MRIAAAFSACTLVAVQPITAILLVPASPQAHGAQAALVVAAVPIGRASHAHTAAAHALGRILARVDRAALCAHAFRAYGACSAGCITGAGHAAGAVPARESRVAMLVPAALRARAIRTPCSGTIRVRAARHAVPSVPESVCACSGSRYHNSSNNGGDKGDGNKGHRCQAAVSGRHFALRPPVCCIMQAAPLPGIAIASTISGVPEHGSPLLTSANGYLDPDTTRPRTFSSATLNPYHAFPTPICSSTCARG